MRQSCFRSVSAGKAAAQPEPIDHCRQPARGITRPPQRQLAAELAANVGIESPIVGALQAAQHRLVHAGGPEIEPCAHGHGVGLAGVEAAPIMANSCDWLSLAACARHSATASRRSRRILRMVALSNPLYRQNSG